MLYFVDIQPIYDPLPEIRTEVCVNGSVIFPLAQSTSMKGVTFLQEVPLYFDKTILLLILGSLEL